jgi:hypothetical protein
VKLWLEDQNLGRMHDRTIERWINKHRPNWVEGGVIG